MKPMRPQPSSAKGSKRDAHDAAAVDGTAASAEDDAVRDAKRPRVEPAGPRVAPPSRTPTPPHSRSASPFDEFPPQRTREASRAADKMASAVRQQTEQFSETGRVRVYDQLQVVTAVLTIVQPAVHHASTVLALKLLAA